MEILLAFREWSSAMADLFSLLSSLPESVSLSDIDFAFTCPRGNRISCNVIVNGKTVTDIAFEGRFFSAEDFKHWLEKMIQPAVNGERCPEFYDVYSNGERARLLVAHSSNDAIIGIHGEIIHTPTSLVALQYKGEKSIRFWGFCETDLFVIRFHSAFMKALEAYEEFFNDKSRWPSHSSFISRNSLTPCEKIRAELSSNEIGSAKLMREMYFNKAK